MGGLLTLPTFVEVFPSIDTISAGLSTEQKNQNATLQGAAVWVEYFLLIHCFLDSFWDQS